MKKASKAGSNGSARKKSDAAGSAVPRAQRNYAESFAQIVAVLMRDASYRKMALSDLEWLLIPPLLVSQYALAQAPVRQAATDKGPRGEDKPAGTRILPVAVALWARVSASIDKALSGDAGEHPKLRPADWTSGDHVWIVTVAGDSRTFPKFLEQLMARDFKGQTVKMRVRGRDGKLEIRTLGEVK